MKKQILRYSSILFSMSLTLFVMTYGTAVAESPQLSNEDRYELAMNQWLDKVVWHESHGNWKIDIIDTNGKHSRGCLQYQDRTWNANAKKFNIKGTPFDCNAARKLARAMIEDNHSAWVAWWTTCVKKGVGKPPRLSDYMAV